jgi:hypothetical protein
MQEQKLFSSKTQKSEFFGENSICGGYLFCFRIYAHLRGKMKNLAKINLHFQITANPALQRISSERPKKSLDENFF